MSDTFWLKFHNKWDVPFYLAASANKIANVSVVHKFGRNADVDAAEDVWNYGGTYTYPSTAVANYISSSNNADTQDITVEGLDANYNLQIVTETLVGQTKTEISSGITWIRVFRAYNASTTATAGDVYVYEDDTTTLGVPDTASKVKAKIDQTSQQSTMALYTIPVGHTGFITTFWGNGNGAGTDYGTIELVERTIGYDTFKTKITAVAKEDSQLFIPHDIPRAISEKTDIRIRCTAVSAVNFDLSAGFDLVLINNT